MKENSRRIFDIIEHSGQHLTAEEIHSIAATQPGRSMSLATVYNNLNALYNSGRVHKLVLEGEPDRYDRAIRHDHLICTQCGSIKDVFLPDNTQTLSEVVGESLKSYELHL